MTAANTSNGPAVPWQAQDRAVIGGLRRFAAGRAQGLSGFAVLAGPVAHSLALWRAWQAERGGVAILTGHAGREGVIRACLAGMLAGRDVVADIATVLAPHLATYGDRRMDARELAGRLARQGLPERMALLRSLEHAPEPIDARLLGVCQSLLADPSGAGLAAEAGTVTLVAALRPGGLPGLLAGLLPGLLIVEPALQHDAAATPLAAGSAWLAEAAATALYLGEVVPGLVVGLAAEQARIDAYLAAGPAAQVAARVRAGLVAVAAPAPAPDGRSDADSDVRTGSVGSGPDLTRATWVRRSLEQEQVTPAVLAAFDETVRLIGQASASADASGDVPEDILDRARSKAERTLYEYLAGHPQTAGLFELNGRMPFDFGTRQAEVDLVCRQLDVAVEIDGYFHFRDQEGFRRDRRKDVLLQSHGFLVLRFLASDVPSRLSEITTQILDVVRMQRQRRGQHPQ